MIHEIAIPFLILGLFFPRLTLLFSWLFHALPYHDFPFWGSFLGAVFLPRLLIALYAYQNYGYCVWFWVYLIVQLLAITGESKLGASAGRRSRR